MTTFFAKLKFKLIDYTKMSSTISKKISPPNDLILELIIRHICEVIGVDVSLPDKRSQKYVQILFMHCVRIYDEKVKYVRLLENMNVRCSIAMSLCILKITYERTNRKRRNERNILRAYQCFDVFTDILSTIVIGFVGGIIGYSVSRRLYDHVYESDQSLFIATGIVVSFIDNICHNSISTKIVTIRNSFIAMAIIFSFAAICKMDL